MRGQKPDGECVYTYAGVSVNRRIDLGDDDDTMSHEICVKNIYLYVVGVKSKKQFLLIKSLAFFVCDILLCECVNEKRVAWTVPPRSHKR